MTTNLQSATARRPLPARGKPYVARLQPGLHLGYRAGTSAWIAIGSDGKGGQWHERIGLADDNGTKPDGVTVLTFAQASDKARAIAGSRNGVTVLTKPKSVDEALTAYAADLNARGKNPDNARMPRHHMPAAMLAQPVNLITADVLRTWRNGLHANGVSAATINRTMKPLLAALRQAGADIKLKVLPNANTARDAVLTEAQVRAVVAAAYDIDPAFGLFVQVHAEVGARTSQLTRLVVGDLLGDRLMVPTSRKGGGDKQAERTSVPLTAELAKRLAAAAAGRPINAPLLTQNGAAWGERDHRYMYARAAKAAALPEERSMIYALRHSSIAHALLKGCPLAIVADWHDTSSAIIEAHYGRFVQNHADDLIRRVLVDTAPGANVVPLTLHSR